MAESTDTPAGATASTAPVTTVTAPTEATPVAADAPDYVHHGDGVHSHKRHHHGRHHHHRHAHAGGEQTHTHTAGFWEEQVQRHEQKQRAQGT